ncbi:MAG: Nitrous oxide reductase protein NosZ [Gemmatimonadetes bacterium]|nr:Nitrous oxide reductase protein NosZ [Gemmatimonadota bacterium]
MSTRHRTRITAAALACAAAATVLAASCGRGPSSQAAGGTGDAAEKVYVAPGQYDEFYAFLSGGFSGNMPVYALPSGRMLRDIPVFSQYPEKGWGYSEQTKPMLMTSYGFIPWDDAHHPELSQTDGVPDGRWVFVNANNTPRIARISLKTFDTEEIIEIPNSAGNHSSPFVTQNTEYTVAGTRFSVPIPQADVPISEYKGKFSGTLSFIKVDSATGRMAIAFQILMPGFDYDLSHSGKGPSHGWSFFTSYNSEQANTLLEKNASQRDKDFIAAINWKQAEKCVADGKAVVTPSRYYHNVMGENQIATSEVLTSTKVLTPAACPGMVYYLPTPKSPHGVDVNPSGEFIAAGGKLASVIPVHSFAKMMKAIETKDYEGEVSGIPVLKYDDIISCEVKEPGLGPLHTEFDDKGNGYTSMFLSSEVVKWRVSDCAVLDRIPTYYSLGHIMIPGGDSRKPWGKYLLAMNKITKDRYLPTGPELNQAAQLIDISGDKMKLLLDFPTVGEPHYAQGIPASLIKDNQLRTYALADNKDPFGSKSEKDVNVVRKGNRVDISMTAIRSHFVPDNIEGIQVGDSVFFHITNLEQDWDVPHGFAVTGAHNSELLIMPGQTRTIVWVPERIGVFPFYCTDFCSALHQEMQGYIRVSPKGGAPAIAFNAPK